MTVQLSSLVVRGELDASKYAAGAQQKQAADKGMVASGQQVAQTQTQVDQKLSASGDVLARLSRGYVEGYRAQERFEQGLRSLNRGLETGKISMQQAETILVGMNQKLGLSANASDIAGKGQVQLAAAVKNANAALAAQKVEIDQVAASMKRLDAANDNSLLFRRRNLTYQAFDVAQMAALGQAPGMLLLQQGPQIAQIYAGQGGIRAALSDSVALVARLARGFGPVALAVGAGAAAIQSMREDIERTEGRTVSFGETATAVFKVIASDIYGLVEPAVNAIAPWFDLAWDKITAGVKVAGNLFVAGWVVQIDAVKFLADSIPDAFIAAGEAAANGFLSAIEQAVRESLVAINDMLTDWNGALRDSGIDFQLPLAPPPMSFRLGRVDVGGAAAADRLGRRWSDFREGAEDAFSRDYVGDYYGSVRDRVGQYLPAVAGSGIDRWANLRDRDDGAIARLREIQRAREAEFDRTEDRVYGFLDKFTSTLMSSGGDIGEAFGQAVLAGFQDVAKEALKNFATEITKAILGYDRNGAPAGGGSILGSLFGNNDNKAPFNPTTTLSAILGGADNTSAGKIARMPLEPISSSYSVANATNFIRQYASSIGIDPDIALRVARSEGLGAGIWQSNFTRGGFREPSFGPFQLLKGGKGTGFGTGLGNVFQARTGLDPADPANWQRSTAFALDQAKAGGWGPWYGAKGQGITGFEGIDRSATKAAGSMEKLSSSSISTAQALTGSLGSLSQQLMGVGGGAGGSGWFSGLMGMFGGAAGATRFMMGISPAATQHIAAGFGGLFDVGGYTGQGGKHEVAGLVHRGEVVWSQDDIRRAGGVNIVEAMRKGMPGFAMGGYVGGYIAGGSPAVQMSRPTGMHITWGWERGSDGNLNVAIKDVAQQEGRREAGAAVGAYAYKQRQGGAAADDHRYKRLKRTG